MKVAAAIAVLTLSCVGCTPAYVAAPAAEPSVESWDSVPCDIAQANKKAECEAEHKRIGIAANETFHSARDAAIAAAVDDLPDTDQKVEAARVAVDHMLASTLKDPMSAIQYRLSEPFSCKDVLSPESAAKVPNGCMCYEVNAKNSFGGYTGSQLSIALLVKMDDRYVAVATGRETPSIRSVQRCASVGLQNRDANLIHAAVQ
jgi:hypothetical protein